MRTASIFRRAVHSAFFLFPQYSINYDWNLFLLTVLIVVTAWIMKWDHSVIRSCPFGQVACQLLFLPQGHTTTANSDYSTNVFARPSLRANHVYYFYRPQDLRKTANCNITHCFPPRRALQKLQAFNLQKLTCPQGPTMTAQVETEWTNFKIVPFRRALQQM